MAEITSSSASESFASRASSSGLMAPLSQRQVAELTDAFNKFDLDKDGQITKTELAAVLRQLGMNPSDDDIEVMVREADTDGDGRIDLDEFLHINAAAERLNDVDRGSLMKEVFEIFDEDKNGVICAEELHSVLAYLGDAVTVDDCRQMIKGVDANGDGVVDFPEFQKMMMRTDLLPCSS